MATTQIFKLLFVDDDPDFRDFHRAELQKAGFDLIEAENETEALDLLQSGQKFDIAVIDVILANPDGGFSLAYHIKQQFPEMPVVLVSDTDSKFGVEFSMNSEAERRWMKCDDFLSKPVRTEQLISTAYRHLGVDLEEGDAPH
jgi:CheY-like chemotaxis protein